MESTRPLLVLGLSATAAAAAAPAAALQGSTVQPEVRFFNNWVTMDTLEHYARVELGSFGDSDTFVDAAVLVRNTSGTLDVHQHANLQHFNTVELVATDVKDMAVLPDVAAGRDGLLVLDSTGLRLFEPATGSSSLCSTCYTTVSTGWTSSKVERVWVVEDSGGDAWLLGYYQDPATSTYALVREDYTNLSLSPPNITVTSELVDVMAIDWDGTGELELVLWSVNGTTGVGTAQVIDWEPSSGAPTVRATYTASPSGSGKPCVGVSRGDSTSSSAGERDLLVLYGHDAGSSSFVLEAHGGYSGGFHDSHDLGARACAALTTLHHENAVQSGGAPGLQEVVLASATDGELYLLERTTSGFQYSSTWGDVMELVEGAVLPEQPATLLVGGDLDGDEDGDVLAFQDGNDGLQLLFGGVTTGWRPKRLGTLLSSFVAGDPTAHPPTPSTATVYAWMPQSYATYPSLPAGHAVKLLVEAWSQYDLTGAVSTQRADAELVDPPSGGADYAMIGLEWDDPFDPQTSTLHVYSTVVWVDGNGDIVRYFPSHLEIFAPAYTVESTLEDRVYRQRWGSNPGTNDNTSTDHGTDGGDGNVCGTRTTNPPPGPPPAGIGKRPSSSPPG